MPFGEQALYHSSAMLWRQPAEVQVLVSSWASYFFDLWFHIFKIGVSCDVPHRSLRGIRMNGNVSTVSAWLLECIQYLVAVISTAISPTSPLKTVVLQWSPMSLQEPNTPLQSRIGMAYHTPLDGTLHQGPWNLEKCREA